MKRIRFTISTFVSASDVSEVVEVDDNITEEEINEMYSEWVSENNYGGWEEL